MGTRKQYLEATEARLGETAAQLEELMAQATHSDYAEYLTDIRTNDVVRFEFNAHGESAKGPDKGPVYTHHQGSTAMKVNQPGML